MAVIFPKQGQEKEVAQRLLALANDVNDVRTSMDEGLAFVVPDYLYQLYLNPTAPEDVASPLSEDQTRRRPGRPRKALPPKEGD